MTASAKVDDVLGLASRRVDRNYPKLVLVPATNVVRLEILVDGRALRPVGIGWRERAAKLEVVGCARAKFISFWSTHAPGDWTTPPNATR